MRDGVSASSVHVPVGRYQHLLQFLCSHFTDIDAATWQSRFERERVLDANGKPLAPDDACKTGDRIFYYRELPEETSIPFAEKILYQDEHILVVDKPHFLPVMPSGRFLQQTLLTRLKKSLGIEALAPVHRIDKDTAGLVMFSLNPAVRDAYQALFRLRKIEKTYEAIAPWMRYKTFPFSHTSRLVEDDLFFRSQEIQGEPNSETVIDVIETRGDLAHYRLAPLTGRKHQLRVNMATLGAPILHDSLYPDVQDVADNDFSKPLQLLAKTLVFADPLTGERREFSSAQTLILL
jgi:tRNA pseudouridine32 synthase/23S rRNA pseudouridine746 synthase